MVIHNFDQNILVLPTSFKTSMDCALASAFSDSNILKWITPLSPLKKKSRLTRLTLGRFFRGWELCQFEGKISRRVSNLPLPFAVAFCMLFVSDFLHILFCYLPICFTSDTELSK